MKNGVQRFLHAAMLLCCLGAPFAVFADVAGGVNWLATQQDSNGSYTNAATLVDPAQSTAQTLLTFQSLSEMSKPGIPAATSFLDTQASNNSRYLARTIEFHARAGSDVTALITSLLTYQNVDGGFGLQPGYPSTVLDTAYALQALAATNYTGPQVSIAVGYLLSRQQANGNWTDGEIDSSSYFTAISFRSLWPYRNTYTQAHAALVKAKDFLLSQRDAAGSWGEQFNTALALTALIPYLPDTSSVTSSINGLRSAQLSNGSWNNDPYTTALALQALYLVASPQANIDLSSINGRVVDGSTGLPLKGVAVALVGATTRSTVTNDAGAFVFTNLVAGGYRLDLSLADYPGLAVTATTSIGGTVALGTLTMTKGQTATTATVRGTVTDAVNHQPIAGAVVSVSTSPTPAVTDASGIYQLSGVAPGLVTLRVSRTGYLDSTGSVSLVAGDIAVFSPALTATGGVAAIQGRVIDSQSLVPLAGVAVTISGPTSASLVTAAGGSFSFTNLAPGSYRIQFSIAGYGSASASVVADVGEFSVGDLALTKGSTTPPTPPTTGVVRGVVSDASTRLPLAGVVVSVSGVNSVTDADGSYQISDVPSGTVIVQASLAGYVTASGSSVLDGGATLIFSPMLSLLSSGGSLQGTVKHGVTGAPLSGVTINVTGSITASASTDTSGRYRIDGIPAGTIGAQASLSGFDSVTATGMMQNNTVITFSPLLYPRNTSPPGANTSTITGIVVDAGTSLPIAGATISVASTSVAPLCNLTGPGILFPASGYSSPAAACLQGGAYHDATYGPAGCHFWNYPGSAGTLSCNFVPNNCGGSGTLQIACTCPAGHTLSSDGKDCNPNQGTSSNVTTDAQGGFKINGVSTGNVGLQFTASGHVGANIDVVVPPLSSFDLGQVRLRSAAAAFVDLTVSSVDRSNTINDPQTLALSGTLSAVILNKGNVAANPSVQVLAFYDANGNGAYDSGIDVSLGQATIASTIAVNSPTVVNITVNAQLLFRDAPISVWVDSTQAVAEANELNNIAATADACKTAPMVGTMKPKLKWAWTGSSVLPQFRQVMSVPIVAPIEDTNGDGKIDQNDIPGLIFHSFETVFVPEGVLRALSGKDGRELWSVTNPAYRTNGYGSLAVADIDGDGVIEIIAPKYGGGLIAFEHDGTFKWKTSPQTDFLVPVAWGGASIADMDGDGVPEIVVANAVINVDGTLRSRGSLGYVGGANSNPLSIVADINLDGKPAIVAGPAAYSSTGQVLHANTALNDGYTAVGNFNSDPYPEIVLVSYGSVYLLDHKGKVIWGPVTLPGGGLGGAPTIADVDGDGIPEIGVAGASRYVVFKADGSILWTSPTQDGSSNVTGSSVFDFDGDGNAEIVYNDERFLRIYNGKTGAVLFEVPNSSGTAYELPVVADVDGDGHADIVVCTNDYYIGGNGAGIRVYTDENNSWVPTRKIWNQHSYHITNINDNGTVPRVEQNSWQANNNYRLNAFPDRSASGQPDLTASRLMLADNGQGQSVTLSVRIGNAGAAPSPDGVIVRFYQGDPAGGGSVLGSVSMATLAAGAYRDVSIPLSSLLSGVTVYAVVDPANTVSECNKLNNQTSAAFAALLGRIAVSTDASTYGPNAPVTLNANITNTASISGSFRGALRGEDASGNTVTTFPDRGASTLASGASISFAEYWNTGTALAGTYRLRGSLTDSAGALIHQASSTFTIGSSISNQPAASLRLTTDKPTYYTTDIVTVDGLMSNLTANTIIDGAALRLTIRDPQGVVIFTQTQTVGQLLPNLFRDKTVPYTLTSAPVAVYSVHGDFLDSAGTVWASADTQFTVQGDLSKALKGAVSALLPSLEAGSTQTCTDTITNIGTLPISSLEVHHALVNLDTQQLVREQVGQLNLTPNQSNVLTATLLMTGGLAAGNYACVLQARIGTELKSLAYAPFVLKVPPIRVDANLSVGTKGRLLVLLDDSSRCADKDEDDDKRYGQATNAAQTSGSKPAPCTHDRDPHGPKQAPALSAQRAFLEALLKSAGWSYTVTERADDFTREMRSGRYALYAVLAEQEKLSEPAQQELREAVFRGDGLLIAGAHDARHHKLLDVLGMKLIGQVSNAVEAELLPGPITLSGRIGVLAGDKALRIKRTSAQLLARYRLGGPHYYPGPDERDCCDQGKRYQDADYEKLLGVSFEKGTEPNECEGGDDQYLDAITTNGYGRGRSVFAGFDLLVSATRDGAHSLASQTLLAALDLTEPQPLRARLGAVLPIKLLLKNRGVATTATATIALPQGTSVVDAGGGTVKATPPTQSVSWSVPLQANEEKELLFYLRLPGIVGSVPLHATISVANGVITQTDLTLYIESIASLDGLAARASAMSASLPAYRNTLKEVAADIQKASQASTIDKSITDALRATERLLGLNDPALVALRIDLDEWLRYTLMLVN